MSHHQIECSDCGAWITDWHWNTSATPPQSTVDVFKCSLNDSMQNIPSSIPPPHRNFLMYKHCKTFPRLLSPTPCENNRFLLLANKSTAIQVDSRIALWSTCGKRVYFQGKRGETVVLSRQVIRQNTGIPAAAATGVWEQAVWGHPAVGFWGVFFNLTLKEVYFLNWFSLECLRAHVF